MRKIDRLLEEYGESHQNDTNKLIHWICVPAIFFSVVGLIYSIPVGFLQEALPFLSSFANWATLVLALVLVYYLSISPPLSLGMFFFSALCLALANFLNIFFRGNFGPSVWEFSSWPGSFSFWDTKSKAKSHPFSRIYSF